MFVLQHNPCCPNQVRYNVNPGVHFRKFFTNRKSTLSEIVETLHSSSKNLQYNLYQSKQYNDNDKIKKTATATTATTNKQTNNYSNNNNFFKMMFNRH